MAPVAVRRAPSWGPASRGGTDWPGNRTAQRRQLLEGQVEGGVDLAGLRRGPKRRARQDGDNAAHVEKGSGGRLEG